MTSHIIALVSLSDPRGKGGSCRHAIFVRVVIPAYAPEAPDHVAVALTVVIWACTRAAAVTRGPDVRLIGLPDSLRKFRKFRVRLTELPDALGDLGGVVWAPREVAVGFGVMMQSPDLVGVTSPHHEPTRGDPNNVFGGTADHARLTGASHPDFHASHSSLVHRTVGCVWSHGSEQQRISDTSGSVVHWPGNRSGFIQPIFSSPQ
jgi:hypothetical protein